MKYKHAAREERRIRYNASIWTFLSIAAATIFGFILWLSGVVLGIGAELPIP
jgi:nitrate reductase NapE component